MAIQGLEFDKPTLVDGGHEQKAIVNTASGKQPVNAPTVEDIKRIAKGEAETEGDKSYTKAESDTKFLSKTDAASTYAAKDSVYTKEQVNTELAKKLDEKVNLSSKHTISYDSTSHKYLVDDANIIVDNGTIVFIDYDEQNLGYGLGVGLVTSSDDHQITILTNITMSIADELVLYEITIDLDTREVTFGYEDLASTSTGFIFNIYNL